MGMNAKMKITDIRATALLVPYRKPYHWAQGVIDGADIILIEVHTDEGIIGYGESISSPFADGDPQVPGGSEVDLHRSRPIRKCSPYGDRLPNLVPGFRKLQFAAVLRPSAERRGDGPVGHYGKERRAPGAIRCSEEPYATISNTSGLRREMPPRR